MKTQDWNMQIATFSVDHYILEKLHINLMKISHFVKASYCFKSSCTKINRSIKWDIPSQMLNKSTAIFVHKIVYNGRPSQISKLLRLQRSRQSTQISAKYKAKTSKFQRNLVMQAYKLYNNIPSNIWCLPPKEFKAKVKKTDVEAPWVKRG